MKGEESERKKKKSQKDLGDSSEMKEPCINASKHKLLKISYCTNLLTGKLTVHYFTLYCTYLYFSALSCALQYFTLLYCTLLYFTAFYSTLLAVCFTVPIFVYFTGSVLY